LESSREKVGRSNLGIRHDNRGLMTVTPTGGIGLHSMSAPVPVKRWLGMILRFLEITVNLASVQLPFRRCRVGRQRISLPASLLRPRAPERLVFHGASAVLCGSG
jgi:hypothetical protein